MPQGNYACVPQLLSLCSSPRAATRCHCSHNEKKAHHERKPTASNADPAQPKKNKSKATAFPAMLSRANSTAPW